MKGEQSSELRRCVRSHRDQGHPPGPNPGSPGDRRDSREAASRAARAARGSSWDTGEDTVATKALRTPVEGGPGFPLCPARLPRGVPPLAPRTTAPADSAPPPARPWLRENAAACTRPARARGRPPPPALRLPTIGSYKPGEQSLDATGSNPQSLNEQGGEGPP